MRGGYIENMTDKEGSSQMRTIAYKEEGGLILVISVCMYYVDDPILVLKLTP